MQSHCDDVKLSSVVDPEILTREGDSVNNLSCNEDNLHPSFLFSRSLSAQDMNVFVP